MQQILSMGGRALGWAGVLICLISGLVKIAGFYYLFGVESMTVFTAGIGLIVTGVFAKLESASFGPG